MMTLYSRRMPGPGTFRTRCVLLVGAGLGLGLCDPAFAAAAPIAPSCNESAPGTPGLIRLEMSLSAETVAAARFDASKEVPRQLPTRNSVKFDGYLPNDGSDLRIDNGRVVPFDPRTFYGTTVDVTKAVPEREVREIEGRFSAALLPGHGIIVKPHIAVMSDAGDATGKYNIFRYDTPLVITGLRCATQVDLETSEPVSREGQPQRHVFLHISAYRAR